MSRRNRIEAQPVGPKGPSTTDPIRPPWSGLAAKTAHYDEQDHNHEALEIDLYEA